MTTKKALKIVLNMIERAGSLLNYVDCTNKELNDFEQAVAQLQNYLDLINKTKP